MARPLRDRRVRENTCVRKLIEGRQTVITGDRNTDHPTILDALRPLMRRWSPTAPQDLEVRVTCTANRRGRIHGGSHARFAGIRDDMAFAALIVRWPAAGSTAVRMLRHVAQLPPDYLA